MAETSTYITGSNVRSKSWEEDKSLTR